MCINKKLTSGTLQKKSVTSMFKLQTIPLLNIELPYIQRIRNDFAVELTIDRLSTCVFSAEQL